MDNCSFQGALKSSLFYLSARPRSVNEVVKKLRKKQIPIQVWTVNDDKLLETLISEDIYSIVTDNPERAMEIRESIQNV